MRFLDVGVLLCVALKQPREHFEGCKDLLTRLSPTAGKGKKERVATTFLTPAILYFILENREDLPKERLTQAMKAVQGLNIKILPLKDGRLVEKAAVYAERYDIDFDDAVNAIVMEENGIKEIYALDRDYDKLEWIRRIVPQ
ncbi:MAG: PIN domain-containing protein [Euryarchaeota archaeon]|nr:PIN domain-containing protein [Euryarchaeota archaeon]